MGKLSEKKHTHRDSTGSVMPSGKGLRVLTAAVYRGRLPGVSCLAACTTFAKPPEQRHSEDGPYPCCPRPNCRTPRLYHIEGCVSVCNRLPSARQRHRWYHRRRRVESCSASDSLSTVLQFPQAALCCSADSVRTPLDWWGTYMYMYVNTPYCRHIGG